MKVDKIKKALLKTMKGYSVKVLKREEERIDYALIDGFGSVAVICKQCDNVVFEVDAVNRQFIANPWSLKNFANFINEVEGY